jgi:hypothetical protein
MYNLDWISVGIGWVVGIACSVFVSELVFPIKKENRND